MRALIVGSGGREHALAWKLATECEVIVTPGNPGIAEECEVAAVPAHDHRAIRDLAVSREVDFVLVGPEDPLIQGLADTLRLAEVPVVGPGSHGALLEGSKAFAKGTMREAAIPTAEYQVFTERGEALAYARERFASGAQVAVKASGAALGKGVVVCSTVEEAQEAIDRMLLHEELGEAGRTIVIEDRLKGREFSLITLCSNGSYRSFPVAQDYKRIGDGDVGPNTGGMGTYSPVPWVDAALVEETEVRVVEPILNVLLQKQIDFRGVLFSGLMLQEDTPYCLEFNVRFGDPETQSLMARTGTGIAAALYDVARGRPVPEWEVLDNAAVTLVLASKGYPGQYQKGISIHLKPPGEQLKIFHAGTAMQGGRLVTAGGRVLALTGTGATLEEARAAAYAGLGCVDFEGMVFRTDIAADVLAK